MLCENRKCVFCRDRVSMNHPHKETQKDLHYSAEGTKQRYGCGEQEEFGCLQPTIRSLMVSSSQPTSNNQLDFSMLPDEIVVQIGKSVAKLCGARDFVTLSWTSKRLWRLLLIDQETISDVIAAGNSRIRKNRSSTLLPSCSSEPIVVTTVEQLAFYESVKEQNLLEENRFNPHFGSKVQQILKEHPSAIVILDAHSGRGELMATTPYGHFDYRAKHAYEKIVPALGNNNINNNNNNNNCSTNNTISSNRIRIRSWGRTAAEKASESQHPYCTKARKGKGWVEVFFRLEGLLGCPSKTLELPPRPDFYRHLAIPQEQQYENFVYFDSDSD